jgi:hypothetical protein
MQFRHLHQIDDTRPVPHRAIEWRNPRYRGITCKLEVTQNWSKCHYCRLHTNLLASITLSRYLPDFNRSSRSSSRVAAKKKATSTRTITPTEFSSVFPQNSVIEQAGFLHNFGKARVVPEDKVQAGIPELQISISVQLWSFMAFALAILGLLESAASNEVDLPKIAYWQTS